MEKSHLEKLREEFVAEIRSRLIGPRSDVEELRERPQKRYLTGMVFPRGASAGRALSDEELLSEDTSEDEDAGEIDSPMDLLFQKLPASVGLTFALADDETLLEIELAGACYERSRAESLARTVGDGKERKEAAKGGPLVWKRKSLTGSQATESIKIVLSAKTTKPDPVRVFDGGATVHLFIRRSQGTRIATVSLVNDKTTAEDSPAATEDILFQVAMRCRPARGVLSYPDPPRISPDPEAEELALQYRSMPTFAVGHGCGVIWPEPVGGIVADVAVDYLPAVEVPPVTTELASLPDAVKEALLLARLQDSSFDPLPGFRKLVSVYRAWQEGLAREILDARFEVPRAAVLERIATAVGRMEDGIALLESDAKAMRIFRLANRAMLLNIARSNANTARSAEAKFEDVDLTKLQADTVQWRPFQLAFLLISLRGLWDATHEDRKIVDLIWFPTGGGKTEAYLAVAAFEMLRRRIIEGERGTGTAVIKRYTLRLLTIQQFERAGGLICALETLRRKGELPGGVPFSLGLWVGNESSPNDFAAARGDFMKIVNAAGKVEGVKVPLKKCPVCATSIVPAQKAEGFDGVGMREQNGRIELFCPNNDCSFHDSLPISFIDDYLYGNPPTMLLGTVDKFAMLAWRHEARAFFGTGKDVLPASLIIQDELHLISGPLGTMAGLYEAAIDTVIAKLGPPAKYISATATIRRADDQIRKLYGRKGALFPPSGLDAADSFFSRVQKGESGRLYLGAMGQGHTPTFSNVISSSALLAAGGAMRQRIGDLADTWWTLVAYHNSKRELGKTLSLARDDIPARLTALGEPRKLAASGVRELSANLKDSEIPETLHHLGIALPDKATLDYVACTNMLSVGVDVQRLGLMLVNGQPKTVSEYIQASSRVGRDAKRPSGIIFALFSPTKPRDRSHYEYFRAFHKGYYRHVEPTSVTPFALPAQERGLHGAFLALVRMISDLYENNHASRIGEMKGDIDALAEAFLERIAMARDGDINESRERLREFIDFWAQRAAERGRNLRFQSSGRQHSSLIRAFRKPGEGWQTLQSLRHVDIPLKLIPPVIQQGPQAVLP